MAKRMELLVEIGSKLNAKFGAVFSSAQKQVSALDKQLKDLNSKKETFSRYESLKKEMLGTTKAINEQKAKLRGLKKGLDQTADPQKQKKLKQEIKQTEQSISKMTRELGKQKAAFQGVRGEIQNGGGYRQYREEIQRTEEQLRRLEQQQRRTQQLRNLQSGLQSKGEALKQSGTNNIKTGMLAGAAVIVPVKLALDDEEAFAGVKKVANMENPELLKLKGELQGLTKEIPIVTTGMYEIAEASLQAGIGAGMVGEAKIKEVKSFTELTAKTATAMDIAESQAGEWLATWKQNLKLTNGGVQELADRMNHLSDMNNAKAEDIANIFSKIMGTGKVAGFTTQEMVALATSIKAAGVDAEQAGTHLDIMMSRLGKGDRASKQTREALQSIGLDAQKVANDMQKPGQASAVFLDVLEKIQKLPAGERLGVANHIFGGDAGKTAAKLVANTDILKGNLEEMTKYEWQGSIGREFDTRSATGMNELKLAFNNLRLAGIKAGETIAPSLTQIVMSLILVIDKISEFITKNPEMVKSIGLAVAGFAGFNLALGAGKIAFGNILIGASKLIGLFIKLGGIPGMIAKIGPALGALTGPVGWVVMAIVGLIAAFVLLYKKSVWFRNGVNKALNMIKPHIMALANLLKGYLGKAFEKLKQYGTQAMPHIRNAFNQMKPVIAAVGKFIVMYIITKIKVWIAAIKIAVQVLKFLWPAIKVIGKLLIQYLLLPLKIVMVAFKAGKIVFSALWNFIKWNLQMVKQNFITLKEVAIRVWEGIKNVVKAVITPIAAYFKWVGQVFSYIWNGAKEIMKATWGLIVTIIQVAVQKIVSKFGWIIRPILQAFNRIVQGWKNIFNLIVAIVGAYIQRIQFVFNRIVAVVSNVWNQAKTLTSAVFSSIVGIVSGIIGRIKAVIGTIISKVLEILSSVKSMFSEAWNTAAGYVETAVGTITTKIGEIISKLGEVIGKVKEAFNPANWTVVASITAKIKEVKEKLDGKYTGDMNYKGGLTWLAERGRELVKYPSGEMTVAASKAVHYLPPGTRIYSNSDTEKILNPDSLNAEEHQAFSKLNSAGGLSQYTDNKFKGISSVSSTVNKTKVSESSGGINITIHNHYGNQTTAQIKETNTDLSQKVTKVLKEQEDRKRRVSLA